jgi:hypothetical protein
MLDPVVLGGVMVSVLAIGPKVCGFNPGRGRWIFKGDKIRNAPSFRGKVKPLVPYRKMYGFLKIPLMDEQRYFARLNS